MDDTTDACNELIKEGYGISQYSFPTVKPIDTDVIKNCAKNCDYIVTVEEHNVIGGLGGAVAEVMAEYGGKARLVRLGLNDQYCVSVGNQNYLREQYGMDKGTIINRIKEMMV